MSFKGSKFVLRLFPSLTDLAFLLPIIGLFVYLEGAKTLLGDGDTGWHIRTGDWILQNHQVPYKDLFSFSKPGSEWFAWEWGWDVLFSIIHRSWGLSGVVVVNILILGLVGVLTFRLIRRRAPNDAIAFLVAALAICGSSIHWLARPHLLSWLFILAFLHLIERAEEGRKRLLWWTPALMLLWVNLHGSFFIGILFLTTYGTGHLVEALLSQKTGKPLKEFLMAERDYLLSALACLAVSFLNPYGWRLHQHVVQYLFDAKQLGAVSEFASISFHSPYALRVEFFLVFGICAAFHAVKRGRWAEAANLVLWGHFALKSGRNIPIFVFVAGPAIAELIKLLLLTANRTANSEGVRRIIAGVLSLGNDFRAIERVERIPLLPSAAILGSALLFGLIPGGYQRIRDFNEKEFPVEAASVIAAYPHPRVFTFDQWGDYLIYRFFPTQRVFVDGRSDFYGSGFGEKWLNTIRARYDWNAELTSFAIDTVLIKAEDPLASVLKQSREWKPVFDNGGAIVFRRKT